MIYLDNAATTPLLPEVREAMAPFLAGEFGNPSSIHTLGRAARRAVEAARQSVADLLACTTDQLTFTSGGTESVNTALFGVWLAMRQRGRTHIVTTAIEHHAVLDACAFLESLGASVSRVAPQASGIMQVDDVVAALRPDTGLVSVMAVNNETGAVQPVRQVAAAVKDHDAQIVMHTDAIQAITGTPDVLGDPRIDLVSVSAHKIHGPKGIGALVTRDASRWRPLAYGGRQEHGRRGGTENVAGIIGFAAAAQQLICRRAAVEAHLHALRERFWRGLVGKIDGVRCNSPEDGSPGVLNIACDDVKNDRLLMRLDLAGVFASAGSACTAGSVQPSHVLLSMGQSAADAAGGAAFQLFTPEHGGGNR